jgi:uncharacterized phage protein gp47/JayE
MAYIDQYNLAQDSVFPNRVRVAMLIAAVAVQAESSGTGNHANRSHYAALVLNSPDTYAQVFTETVCAANGLTSSSTDADILTEVQTVWNALAGVV